MLTDYSLPKIADAARIQLHLCAFSPFRPLTAGLEGAVQQSQYHKGPVFLSFSGHLTPYDSESNPPPNYRNPVLNNPLFSTSSTPSPPHHHSLTSTPSTTAALSPSKRGCWGAHGPESSARSVVVGERGTRCEQQRATAIIGDLDCLVAQVRTFESKLHNAV